jgi:hypothetical protein
LEARPLPDAGDTEAEWPDEGAEDAFLSESAARGEVPVPVAAGTAEPSRAEKLPALDELVARVPANVAGLLDDLFRAKFTAVRRFPEAQAGHAPPK